MPSKTGTPGNKRRPSGRALRRQMVEQLEGDGCLTSPVVGRAFRSVPRERFLSEIAEREGLERVYQDQAIVTAKDERGIPASSSSQPSMMASMLEQLDLRPGQRVLEIGAGTGYNAALLARIVGARGEVTSVELDPATARGARRGLASVKSPARVVRGDGHGGWVERRFAGFRRRAGSGCSHWRSPRRASARSACAPRVQPSLSTWRSRPPKTGSSGAGRGRGSSAGTVTGLRCWPAESGRFPGSSPTATGEPSGCCSS